MREIGLVVVAYMMIATCCALLLHSRAETRSERLRIIADIKAGDSLQELRTTLQPHGAAFREVIRGHTEVRFQPRLGQSLRLEHADDSITVYTYRYGSDGVPGPPFPWSLSDKSDSLKSLLLTFVVSFIFWLPSAIALIFLRRAMPLMCILALLLNSLAALALF